MCVEIDLSEELEGEGTRDGQAERLLVFDAGSSASLGEAGSDLDFSMTLSALLWPECLCASSSSNSLVLFKDDTRGPPPLACLIVFVPFCWCC